MKLDRKDLNQLKKWINALRSGKYKQGRYALQDSNNGYCCLGVACKILIPTKYQFRNDDDCLLGTKPNQQNSPLWLRDIDSSFKDYTNRSLMILNDHEEFNFNEISDLLQAVYIEKCLEE